MYVLIEMSFGFIATVLNVIVLATIKNSNRLLSEPAYLLIVVFDISLCSDINILLIPYISANNNFLEAFNIFASFPISSSFQYRPMADISTANIYIPLLIEVFDICAFIRYNFP